MLVNVTKAKHGRIYGSGYPVGTPGHKEKCGQPIFTIRKESGPGKTENLGSNDKMLSWDCVS